MKNFAFVASDVANVCKINLLYQMHLQHLTIYDLITCKFEM